MFGKKKKESPSSAQAGITVPPETLDRIRTMPDRFYLAPRTRANRTFIVFGVLIIVVGLLVAVALWMWKFGPSAGGPAATPTPEASVTPATVPTPVAPLPTPSPTPETAPIPTPTPEPSPSPAASPSAEGASDADADGLTFNEERLYGTDPAQGDSDGDGFLDGAEVANGYSPRDAAGKRLLDDGSFTAVESSMGFRLASPASWLFEERTEAAITTARIDSRLGDFFTATQRPNVERLDLRAWVKQQGAPAVVAVTVNGVAGLKTSEVPPRYFFLTPEATGVVVLEYGAAGERPNFLATFAAVAGSFQWQPPGQ